MSKFRLFSDRILTLLFLFLTPVFVVIATNSSSLAENISIAQIITSPGLTKPLESPPLSTEELPVEILVPPPKNPLPSVINPIPSSSTNYTYRGLSSTERDRISSYLSSRNLTINSTTNNLPDPRFILHDTSFIMSPSLLDRERRSGRGPLGLGVNAYLPGENSTVLARPNFYEARRPTTTEFEKASDILDREDREKLLRQAWKSTNDDARRQALDTALANLDLSSAEIATEQTAASEKLAASSGRIYTTATWAVEAICTRFNGGDRQVAAPNQLDNLSSACDTLGDYFKIRNSRVKSAVAVEIIQVGAISDQGNQNTCSASNPNIATLPTLPISHLDKIWILS